MRQPQAEAHPEAYDQAALRRCDRAVQLASQYGIEAVARELKAFNVEAVYYLTPMQFADFCEAVRRGGQG
jgi:hypothetical protein